MSSLRQLGGGLFYALVSVVLVVGGLSLALAEGSPAPAGPVLQPSAAEPSAVPPSAEASPTIVVASATGLPASATAQVAPTSTPVVIYVTATSVPATATPYVPPRATSTRAVYVPAVQCGPYAGWIRGYTVKQGDTLFHIATLYRTTVNLLQAANCLGSTFIQPGQLLWVPNVPTITPGVTIIPTFVTSTAIPTEPLTLTPIPYFTETSEPSATPIGNTGP